MTEEAVQIAEAVARLTGAQPVSLTSEQAQRAMGPHAEVLTRPSPLDPSRAEQILDWKATGPTLLDELRTGSYALDPRS